MKMETKLQQMNKVSQSFIEASRIVSDGVRYLDMDFTCLMAKLNKHFLHFFSLGALHFEKSSNLAKKMEKPLFNLP